MKRPHMMRRYKLLQTSYPTLRTCIGLPVLLALTACGSAPIDESQYKRVETQISEAEEVQARDHAGAELFSAQDKLKKARAAEQEGDRERAIALLQEAELHAELAEVRSMTKARQDALDEINRGLDALQRELAK